MDISIDRLKELIGEVAESKIRGTLKPFTDEFFEQLNKPKSNKLLGTWGESSNKMLGAVRGKSYREMFGKGDHLSDGGFSDFDDFLKAIRNKDMQRLTRELGETVGSEGGFLLADKFRAELLDLAIEDEIVRPRAKVYPTKKGNNLIVPALGGLDRSTQGIFGCTAVWTGEGTSKTITDPVFRQIELKVNKLVCFTKTSDEWQKDSEIPLRQTVGIPFAKSIGYFSDLAYLNGTGSGQPRGIISAPCTVVQAGETGQDASSIVAENTIEMLAHLLPQCYAKACWVANIDCLPMMFKMHLKLGTGAERIPIMKGTLGNFELWGLPVYFTDKVPSLGSKGCLGLYSFDFYAILLRDDLRIESSQHPDWRSDKTQWRAILRVDGQPILNTAVTAKGGSHTMSSFVVLDAVT